MQIIMTTDEICFEYKKKYILICCECVFRFFCPDKVENKSSKPRKISRLNTRIWKKKSSVSVSIFGTGPITIIKYHIEFNLKVEIEYFSVWMSLWG